MKIAIRLAVVLCVGLAAACTGPAPAPENPAPHARYLLSSSTPPPPPLPPPPPATPKRTMPQPASVPAPAAMPVATAATVRNSADEFSVSMSRSACFGRCPQYRVTIYGDGLVEFVGERNVGASGKQSKRVSAVEASKLRAPARELFGTMQDYVPGNKACQPYATDMPTISMTLNDGGVHRALRHYLGCPPAPATLAYFEQQFDAIANVRGWVQDGAAR